MSVIEPSSDRLPGVFLVGTPRSGTTLLAAQMSRAGRYFLGPETHFFNKMSHWYRWQAKLPVVNVFSSWGHVRRLKVNGADVARMYGIERDDYFRYFGGLLSKQEMAFCALVEQSAKRAGCDRWLEKTPNHLAHLPEVRNCFKDTPIISISRDPRDSVVSMQKLPWVKSIGHGCDVVRSWHQASEEFLRNDGRCLCVRYEDLVGDPLDALNSIFLWLGVSVTGDVNPEGANPTQQFIAPGEWWKGETLGPVTREHAYRFLSKSCKETNEKISAACESYIRFNRYDL